MEDDYHEKCDLYLLKCSCQSKVVLSSCTSEKDQQVTSGGEGAAEETA